jgi:hypothetical protein
VGLSKLLEYSNLKHCIDAQILSVRSMSCSAFVLRLILRSESISFRYYLSSQVDSLSLSRVSRTINPLESCLGRSVTFKSRYLSQSKLPESIELLQNPSAIYLPKDYAPALPCL